MSDTNVTPDLSAFSDDEQSVIDALLAQDGFATSDASPAIAPRTDRATAPLSFAQEVIWLLDHATPNLIAYNMAFARRLRGAMDVDAFRSALESVVARHPALRTRFVARDGEPVQAIDPPSAAALRVLDVSGSADPETEARRALAAQARTPFDLAREHMFRATLLRLGANDHVLLLETHHIICDGWSVGLVFADLAAAYAAIVRGRAPALAPLPIDFGDFAAWQRDRMRSGAHEAVLQFWRDQLRDATEPLALPTDRPRSSAPSFEGGSVAVTLPAAVLADIKALGQRHGATLYMTLLAAYMTVLHRYTGRAVVLVGSAVAGRTEAATEEVVGYFSNTVVQRGDFSGDPGFGALLDQVRSSALDAYDHQEVPLETVALERREAGGSAAPLFDVVFTMQDTGGAPMMFDGVTVSTFPLDVTATKFELTLLPSEQPDGLRLALQYRSDLFDRTTAQRFLGHLTAVLTAAVANPDAPVSALPLLTDAEERELAAWNATDVDMGAPCTILELVRAQVQRVPSTVAVAAADGSLTYTDLDGRANQLARHLRAVGVGKGARVGLLLDRSADAIVGLLGILGAGAAYVPLLPETPPSRLAEQIREGGIQVVVTLATLAAALPPMITAVCLDRDAGEIASRPTGEIALPTQPSDEAYVLFTSGSTGVPKGVAVTHANVVHYTRAISRVLADVPKSTTGDGLAALDGWHFAMVSTLGADLGNTCLFPALCAGGTLHVLAHDVVTDPARYAAYARANAIDVMKITPSHLRALVGDQRDGLASLLPRRWVVLGGETLPWELADTLRRAGACRVLDHYGPTETTVGATTFEVTDESTREFRPVTGAGVPIGRALPNVRLSIVDRALRPVPVGVPGELLIAGGGVAQGYVGRPALTRQAFVTTPDGRRAYRTGDRARWRADGVVEFLGRTDRQVKVRGYRVELGDVEHVVSQNPDVEQAVVVASEQDGGATQLVAYVVARAARKSGYAAAHASVTTDALQSALVEWLATRLPEHMRPAALVLLDAMPLTANGKIDVAALPSASAGTATAAAQFVDPRTDSERGVAAIWCEVLKKERIGATDDFIALGGHSLLAIRILGKITRQFGVRMPLRTLFDAPTVEQLAAAIDRERAAPAAAAPAISASARDAFRIGTAPAQSGTTGSGEQR